MRAKFDSLWPHLDERQRRLALGAEARVLGHGGIKLVARAAGFIDLIGATTTRTGLKVHAELDDSLYPTGIKISGTQMAALPITRHDFHGDWNYTLTPANPR